MNGHSSITVAELEAALTWRLGQPNVRAGLRLKTGRWLATRLGTSHATVSRALGGLEEQGVVARKHGSGVYVRKVTESAPPPPKALRAALADLFEDDAPPTRLRPGAEQVRLHLHAWGDVENVLSCNQMQLGMRDYAEELGHRVDFHMLDPNVDPAESAGRIAKLAPVADGHVVFVPLRHVFLRHQGGSPVVYIWASNVDDEELQPLVQMDMSGALRRGLRRLAAGGNRWIGLLDWVESAPLHQPLYEDIMLHLGIKSYRATAFSNADPKQDRAAIRTLFTRPDPPEALYVADDVMLANVLPELLRLGFTPGKNLAVITHANRKIALPPGFAWSRMEFNPYAVGRLTMQSLLREIESVGDDLLSFSHQAAWIPGTTHLRGHAPDVLRNGRASS